MKKTTSIALSENEVENLTDLADELESTALTGRTAGLASWRRLIKDLAAGRFVIRLRFPAPKKKPRRVAPVTPRPVGEDRSLPLWWPREFGEPVPLAAVDSLPSHVAEDARTMGLAEIDGDFHALDEWLSEPVALPAVIQNAELRDRSGSGTPPQKQTP